LDLRPNRRFNRLPDFIFAPKMVIPSQTAREVSAMDMWRYFDITHRDHDIMNPISSCKLNEMIALLRLPAGARVLDIGCGKAEPLVRIAEKYAISGIGVDPSPGMIAESQKRATARVQPPSHLDFLLADGASFQAAPASFDLTICLGASWALGGYRGTLQALANFTSPQGLVLVGEPYWLQEPAQEYLKLGGIQCDDFATYAGNAAIGLEVDLTPLYVISSSKEDYDRYEWLQVQAAERFAVENPTDPDVPKLLKRMRSHRDLYLRYGRDTMAWAMYLFRK
jgi:SAM-dependent methyltransferase